MKESFLIWKHIENIFRKFSKRMSDFEKQKFEIEELILLLEPYTDGELGFLLNAKENVDIVHDKLIAFDMEDASKKEYFRLWPSLPFRWLSIRLRNDREWWKGTDYRWSPGFPSGWKVRRLHQTYLYRTFRKKRGKHHSGSTEYPFSWRTCLREHRVNYHQLCYKEIPDPGAPPEPYPEISPSCPSMTKIYMIESLQKDRPLEGVFIKMSNDTFIFRNEVSDFAAVYLTQNNQP